MAPPRSEEPDPHPAIDPIAWLGGIATRFGAWARRVGEERIAYAVLAVAFVLAAFLILHWGRGQSFVNDEWNYLVVFRGWGFENLITPQNGHLIVFPLILYKTLFGTVGADSHVPYQVATVVLHLIVATIFFALVRRRLPLAVAVGLTLLVVFFGAGWDTLMGAYELPNLSGMAAGLGMLLALRRRTRGGDIAACVLLVLCLGSFSVGIAFALGALISLLLGGRSEWRRLWVVLVPGLTYAAWFIWARKFGQGDITVESISSVFSGSADQIAAITAAITGLFRVPGSVGLPVVLELRSDWGYPLAIVLMALVALHVRRAPRSIFFWTLVATLVLYLALVAFGLSPARTPFASRYVYMGGIISLLLVAELARDIKWSTVTGLLAVVVLGLSLMANASTLRAGARLFQAEGETNRATLAALEIARDKVDRGLLAEDAESTVHSHPDMFFPIWAYFELADDQGSPAYDLTELETAGEQAREAADQELVRTLEIETEPVAAPKVDRAGSPPAALTESNGQARNRGACLVLVPEPGRTATFQLELPPGGFSFLTRPGTAVTIKLGRFADLLVNELPAVTGSGEVAIPTDSASNPWRAEFTTEARTLACAR
jgi:uncharacterized membrane protein